MRARSVLAGVAVGLALAGTIFAVATAPDNARITAPFAVRGSIGDTLVARELAATVTGVRAARQLKVGYSSNAGSTATDGVWVIVDADVTPRLGTVVLEYSTLTIDGVDYQASDILPNPSLISLPYGSDITMHGSLVFEIPKAALASGAAARASVTFNHGFELALDSVPVVAVDLSKLDVQARAVIEGTYVVDKK